jgi:AsmA protein
MELPVEMLRTLQAKGDVRIATLRLSGLHLQNSRLALNAAGGELKLDPIATDLYQGSYVGRIQLNATGAVPRLEFQTELKDVNIEPLLADLNNASSRTVSGIAGFTAALGASGRDTAQIRQNLSGQGSFAIRDGVYHGVNIPAVLSQTELMLKSRSFGAIRKEGDTAFEQLGGTIQVNNGLMRSDDFLMRAPGFQAQGAGLLYDLNTGAIDYDLTVGVDPATATRDEERYDLGGYSIPISCRAAPPKSPSVSCLPDISRIAKAVGTKVITNQVQRLLQGRQQQPDTTDQQPEQPAAEEPKGNVGEQLLRRGLENLLKR